MEAVDIFTPTITNFLDAMADSGLVCLDQVIADGNLHRFTPDGDRPKTNAGWYVLHLDGLPAGSYGSFRTGVSQKWCSKDVNRLSENEKREFEKRIKTGNASACS